MNIILVDDDAGVLRVTRALLRQMGHGVQDFADPVQAVSALSDNHADLVISDVQMPVLDGFDVAEHVARTCGTSPPKVLLMSGSDDVAPRLRATPPATVIGLLAKPFNRSDLSRVLSLVEQTRTCCPGTVAPFCPYLQRHHEPHARDAVASTRCHTSSYAECPHYSEHCGKTLRLWIETRSDAREPSAHTATLRPAASRS